MTDYDSLKERTTYVQAEIAKCSQAVYCVEDKLLIIKHTDLHVLEKPS